MPRGTKIDREATKGCHFLDPRSFLSIDGHHYLKGDDIRERRTDVYERDKGICQKCGSFADWNRGHMHHLQGGLVGRCDDLTNLQWLCPPCHHKEHVQVKFSKKIA